MRAMAALLEHPVVVKLGLALVHFLWQGAALAVVALVLLLAMRRAKPAARYVALLVVMAAMVAAPVATFLVMPDGATPATVSAAVEAGAAAPAESAAAGGLAGATAALPAAEPPPPPPLAEPKGSSMASRVARAWEWLDARLAWVAAGWVIGVLMLSVRLLLGWIGVARARRRGVEPAGESWQTVMATLAQRLKVSRPVRLLESAAAQVPTVIGWLRPVILLPGSALSGLTPQQIEALIAHELAHVRRHDYLANLLQTAVETLLFYHPAVWWLSGRIRMEREHCCDDLAVACCGDAVADARALAEMEQLRSAAPQPAVAASGGSLLARIRRLLGASPTASRRMSSWLAGAVALAAVAAVGLGITVGGCERKAPSREQTAAAEVAKAQAILDEALAAAQGIEDQRMRAHALSQVAWAYVKADPGRALEIARTIERADPRARALKDIAVSLAKTEAARSLEVGIEALDAARQIEDDKRRDWALRDMARVLAKPDPDKALEAARAIGSPAMRAQSLSMVAYEVAEGDRERSSALYEEALEVARSQKGSPGLGDIATRLASTDPERGLQLAMSIESRYYRTFRVKRILTSLAARDLDRALALADTVKEQTVRDRALQRIAVNMAEKDPEKALEIARTMRVHTDFAYVTAVVSRVLARTDKQRSHDLALEALEAARQVTTPRARAVALRMVALALSRTDVDKALEVALSIDSEAAPANRYWHTRALLSVISVLAKSDSERGLEVARTIERRGARANAMASVAKVVRKTDPKRAKEILSEAREVVQGIEEGVSRRQALLDVARVEGKGERAESPTVSKMVDEVEKIEDKEQRDLERMRLAATLAQTDREKALQITRRIENKWYRSMALQGIARQILEAQEKKRQQ